MSPVKGKQTLPEEFVPTEEQILRELKQKEKRKQYMQSDKAKENRQTYMKKRYEETKALRAAIDDMKTTDPEKYAALQRKAAAEVAAGKK